MTPLQELYSAIYSQTLWSHIGTGVVVAIVVALYVYAKAHSAKMSFVALTIFIGGHLLAGIGFGSHYAGKAITTGVEAAKTENKTYIQKLYGFFTDYGEDIVKCSGRKLEFLGRLASIEDGRKATGCYYVRLVEDDEDYYWVPMFTQERRPWGWLDIYKEQKVFFTDHTIAMKDWQNYKAGLLGLDGPWPGEKFISDDPAEWTDLIARLERGEVVEGGRYSLYFNYLLPTDTILKDDWSGKLSLYEGNLPTINPLYGVYKHDFIQFGRNVVLDPATTDMWQKQGSLWATNAAPLLEGDTLIHFVLASQIDDPDNKIKASKAELMQEKFGKESLPKNLILIECGLSDDLKTILWCRFQQGMFVGNNAIAEEISAVANVPFTPEAFFGKITATQSRISEPTEGKRFQVKVTYDQTGIMGKLYDPSRGFKRVEMEESDYLDAEIKPSKEQLKQIQANALGDVWKGIGGFYLFVVALIAKGKKKR